MRNLDSPVGTASSWSATVVGPIANSQPSTNRLHLDTLTRYKNEEILAMTKRPEIFERSVMMSSAIPSAKYVCFGSSDMLSNGRTVMEG